MIGNLLPNKFKLPALLLFENWTDFVLHLNSLLLKPNRVVHFQFLDICSKHHIFWKKFYELFSKMLKCISHNFCHKRQFLLFLSNKLQTSRGKGKNVQNKISVIFQISSSKFFKIFILQAQNFTFRDSLNKMTHPRV